jgi:hypothetical protein
MRRAGREILQLFVLCALVAGSAPATAQAPPDGGQVEPCDPATEPCEEQVPALETGDTPLPDPSSETAEAGIEAAVEEDPAIEASADEEFTPGDEISEDFPIPLPSDI